MPTCTWPQREGEGRPLSSVWLTKARAVPIGIPKTRTAPTNPAEPVLERTTPPATSANVTFGVSPVSQSVVSGSVQVRIVTFGFGEACDVRAGTPRLDWPYGTLVDVTYGEGVTIVEPANCYGCTLGDKVFVGPFVEIQRDVTIGARTRIQSHTFICSLVTIGEQCFIAHGVMFINDLFADGGHIIKSLRTDYAEYVAGRFPNVKYYCMEDAAHWPQWEKPEEHDQVLIDFIKG